jgi:hypothetical protein
MENWALCKIRDIVQAGNNWYFMIWRQKRFLLIILKRWHISTDSSITKQYIEEENNSYIMKQFVEKKLLKKLAKNRYKIIYQRS